MTEKYTADFGKSSIDYAIHRRGFPDRLFARLAVMGIGLPGQKILDLGTGTGTIARRLSAIGAKVTGLDSSPEMIAQAKKLATEQGVAPCFWQGQAEAIQAADKYFDIVIAGQSWHWFDSNKVLEENRRILKSSGRLVICHFDWLAHQNNVAAATEKLICKYSPDWPFAGGSGFYPQWAVDLSEKGYRNLESFSFDHDQLYSHDDWRGRIRASAGVGGNLSAEEVDAFDREMQQMLICDFAHEPLSIPHRCWAIIASPPPG